MKPAYHTLVPAKTSSSPESAVSSDSVSEVVVALLRACISTTREEGSIGKTVAELSFWVEIPGVAGISQ